MKKTNTLLTTPDPDQDWDGQSPADKMSDVQVMTENPVAYVMDHEDKRNRITYECWTPTNEKLDVTCLYPNHMEQDSQLIDFLDAAGIPRTDPTAYDDGTTVPVEYNELQNSWEIDYGDAQHSVSSIDVGVPTDRVRSWWGRLREQATPGRVGSPLFLGFLSLAAFGDNGGHAPDVAAILFVVSFACFVIGSLCYAMSNRKHDEDWEAMKTSTWISVVSFALMWLIIVFA